MQTRLLSTDVIVKEETAMMLKNDSLRRSEHTAVREKVGYYDFTHRMLEVTGKDAAEFLDRIYVNSIATAKVGTAKYTTMLNHQGHILDDVIVFRMGEEEFRVSTLFIDELLAWLDQHRDGYEVAYRDITAENTMFAVQGPNSRTLLNRVLADPIDTLAFYAIAAGKIGDTDVWIARSGFTGELGFEIYCDPADAARIEETLVASGGDLGLTKITTDVIIGSLPGEKGYVLMQDLQGANPYEVGFGWTVGKNKDYIGREATEKIRREGAQRQLLGFELVEEAEVSSGDPVVVHGQVVGTVTSCTYGYTCEKFIGYALICAPAKVGDAAEIGADRVKAVLVDRIWYDKDSTRIRKG